MSDSSDPAELRPDAEPVAASEPAQTNDATPAPAPSDPKASS